ncbi:MAG: quinolinate synthase NadA [Thermoproteus sp.]
MDREGLFREIVKLKKERNAVILGHNYMDLDIQLIADFTGDSYDLALRAAETKAEVIVFAGVRFMAEQAKALNYDRTVLMPEPNAGCTLADALDRETLRRVKEEHPDAPVVLYVNTNADVKALADYIVTSSTAVRVIKRIDSDVVIFGPDSNLARHVARATGKRIIAVPPDGRCVVHASFTADMVKEAKARHPGAKVMAHPESPPEVVGLADFVGSTNQMIEYAARDPSDEFIVVTEIGMLNALRIKVPNKRFYPIEHGGCACARCPYMAMVSLEKLYRSLRDMVYAVDMPRSVADAVREAFERTKKLLEAG